MFECQIGSSEYNFVYLPVKRSSIGTITPSLPLRVPQYSRTPRRQRFLPKGPPHCHFVSGVWTRPELVFPPSFSHRPSPSTLTFRLSVLPGPRTSLYVQTPATGPMPTRRPRQGREEGGTPSTRLRWAARGQAPESERNTRGKGSKIRETPSWGEGETHRYSGPRWGSRRNLRTNSVVVG